MIVREAIIKDIPEIKKLSIEWFNEKISDDTVPEKIRDLTKAIKDKTLFVAVDKIFIGYLIAKISKSNYDHFYGLSKNERYLNIESIFIKNSYRNNNIGKKLIKTAEEYAKLNNIKYVLLASINKNPERLISFYKNNGYSIDYARLFKKI